MKSVGVHVRERVRVREGREILIDTEAIVKVFQIFNGFCEINFLILNINFNIKLYLLLFISSIFCSVRFSFTILS